jgi:protein-disulfide isomerase
MALMVLALLAAAAGGAGAPGNAQAAELVMFEAQGCSWCEIWDAEIGAVYHKTEEGRAAPLRRVDIDEPRPPGLEALRGVVYTPTFVLLDAGREVGRILGYPGEGHFWSLLGELIERLPARPES